MTAIWRNDGTGWQLLAPAGFPDEAALHALVEQAPQILLLADGPSLTVVGREVVLGSGKADLMAVEATGRLAIIGDKETRERRYSDACYIPRKVEQTSASTLCRRRTSGPSYGLQ